MRRGEVFMNQLTRRTGVRCGGEIACNSQFLEASRGSSRSAQTMATKTRVLEATL
jgi:hypothetical protein